MSCLVVIRGNAHAVSRSAWLADSVARSPGVRVETFGPDSLDGADVLLAKRTEPIDAFVRAVRQSDGVLLTTPIYKASYAGALKAIVDLLPEDALRGRLFLGVATGKAADHASAVARALAELGAFFAARAVAAPLVVLDDDLAREGEEIVPSPSAARRIDAAREALHRALRAACPNHQGDSP